MSKVTRQQRIALGLCTDCGGERTGEKHTTRNCGVCAERRRIASRKWRAIHPEEHHARLKKRYETKKAENRCVCCAKSRKGLGGTANLCYSCAKKHRASLLAYQQRKRNERMGYVEGDGRTAKKSPVGRASTSKREGGAWSFPLPLDTPSYDAIQVIRKRYRDAEYKAGREPLTHQNSRLVREIILRYEPSRAAVQPRKHRLIPDWKLHLSLDGRTRAIVQRHADRTFDGNLSATLRAMLIQSQGFRRAFTGRG